MAQPTVGGALRSNRNSFSNRKYNVVYAVLTTHFPLLAPGTLLNAVSLMPTTRRPFLTSDPTATIKFYHCSQCHSSKPESAFLPSSIERHITHCRACQRQRYRRWRRSTPDHVAAESLYQSEYRHRRQQENTAKIPSIGIAVVRRILERYQRRSALSGQTEQLRIRRFWPDLPFSEWNAIVVTARESRHLALCKDSIGEFSNDILRAMEQARATSKPLN